ncbi:MAG: ornithine cyclodeaminase family protein [Hyphomicrobiales bacterium]|nr:ornithine cyclodeaminase family protein [Hyphomicrobiales bacterium]
MTQSPELLYLSRRDLEGLDLTAGQVIESIERAIRGRARGQVWNAPKSALYPGGDRFFMAMLAVADDPPFAVVKSLGLSSDNAAEGRDSIGALITIFDGVSGLPLGIMDGGWVTAVRTAGLSAIAAKRLAGPAPRVAAFIGCGVQALSHLQVFAELYALRQIRAFSRGTHARDRLCRSAQQLGLAAVATASAQEAVEDADLVFSSVPSAPDLVPFLDPDWLKPGAFASAIDLGRSWQAERLSRFDRIVIDDLEQEAAMEESMVRRELIGGDLASLATGNSPARRSDDERILFVFRGLALADLALSALAFEHARKTGAGLHLEP